MCIVTGGNAARVRNLLAVLRPHVDEIVVAVDRRGDDAVLEEIGPLADRRFTVELKGSASWATGWILNQCSGEWILRLDDDEIPSVELLDALPELTSDPRPALIELRRRWLHPTVDRYIESAPWGEEWQYRLLRNVPGSWRFDGRVHTDVLVRGERRIVDTPFYHADLLLQPFERRRAKSLAYEVLRPGLEYNDSPVNGLYVPEAADGLVTAAVPAADRALVETVLDGSVALPSPRPAAPVEHVRAKEIGRFNETREVSPGAYSARIEFRRPARRLIAGGTRYHELLVTNLGDETWPAGPTATPLIRLGYRWREADSRRVVYDAREAFTETVAPGQSTIVRLGAKTPVEPGRYVLEVDVVHEHVRWFEQQASLEVTVEARPVKPLLSVSLSERLEIEREHDELRHELDAAREQAAAATATLADFQATRRYRMAQRLGAPLDRLRRMTRSADSE